MVKTGFTFFDETSTSTTSNSYSNADGSALMLQVTKLDATAISLKVEGLVDLNQSSSYSTVKCVNMGTFATTDTITENGNYLLIVEGMFKVRCVLSAGVGHVKVYANVI